MVRMMILRSLDLDTCSSRSVSVPGRVDLNATGFEAFVNRYKKDAYFIALGLVGNPEDALDLSQEAFYRAYLHRKKLRASGRFFPWFYQILKNLCFTHLKKSKTGAVNLDDVGSDSSLQQTCERFDPGLIVERNELKEKLWYAIGQLGEKHREIIVLRHFRNLSYEQISKLLFCNKGTVTSRLYYARKRLKELLDNQKGGQSL
jgi:RNA polymerase sigma-70 factor (ECF subfamily)